jgi:hypothetical protein
MEAPEKFSGAFALAEFGLADNGENDQTNYRTDC